MYEVMIETRYLKILLKSFHENYSDLLKKKNTVVILYFFLNYLEMYWVQLIIRCAL